MRAQITQLNTVERKPEFLRLQKLVVLNNPKVQKLFPWFWGVVLGFTALGAVVFFIDPVAYLWWYETGRKFGTLAAALYAVTLIPGMLRRTGAFPITRTMLMLTRRQFGVSMFLLVFGHLSLVRVFPLLFTGGDLTKAPVFVLFGMAAFMLLLPLWLTSNETSVKKLGTMWHTIHKLTYIALFAIFFHVLLQGFSWTALFVGTVMTLEVLSWIFPWVFPVQKPVRPVPQPAAPVPPQA